MLKGVNKVYLLSLTIKDAQNEIENLIDKILKNYSNQDININNEIIDDGMFKTVNFYIENEEVLANENYCKDEFLNIFKHYTSIAIADYIVEVLEIKMIEKNLQNNYSYLKPSERQFIIKELTRFLENEFYDKNIEVPHKVNKKAKILYKLMDFMSENYNINVNGFVKFRIKGYCEEINELLDKVIEEYMMEKEYREFIKLLKYFVNIQESKIDFLNILVDKKGKYHFYDKFNNIINDKYIKELIDDLVDADLNYDDLLISTLITIAPKKICIHNTSNIKNSEIFETIKNIFDKRIYICNNCRICNLNKTLKEE